MVEPGTDPAGAELKYEGLDGLTLDDQGNLILEIGGIGLVQPVPLVYQYHGPRRTQVQGWYELRPDNTVGFRLAGYDRTRPLIIDPLFLYSRLMGGSERDLGEDIAADSEGNIYIIGRTRSSDFPVVEPTITEFFPSLLDDDIFVTKINSDGETLEYSTFIGGTGGDYGSAITVDIFGNAFITGYTVSEDFPFVNGFQHFAGGSCYAGSTCSDAFVSKIKPDGSGFEFSSFLGGGGSNSTERGYGVAVDADGNVYVTGTAAGTDFPLKNAFQSTMAGSYDAFVTKIKPDGSAIVYSSYLGGSYRDSGYDAAVDSNGALFVGGDTESSTTFPTVSPLYTCNESTNGWLAKIKPDGSGKEFCTCLRGNSGSRVWSLALDPDGNVVAVGETDSNDFPLVNPYQNTMDGYGDAFISRVKLDGSALMYSTYFGGNSYDYAYGVAVSESGLIVVTGGTTSDVFPVTSDAFQSILGGAEDSDVFLSVFSADGGTLLYSTLAGGQDDDLGRGAAIDGYGHAHVGGYAYSDNYPVYTRSRDRQAIASPPGPEGDVIYLKADVTSPWVRTPYPSDGATEVPTTSVVEAGFNEP